MKGEDIIEFRGDKPKEPYVRTDRIAEDIADTIALELGWTEDEFEHTKEEIEEHLNFLNEWEELEDEKMLVEFEEEEEKILNKLLEQETEMGKEYTEELKENKDKLEEIKQKLRGE